MNKQQKFISAMSIIGIVATFMPWISVSAGAFGYSFSESRNGFHGMGVLYFLIMVAMAIIASANTVFAIAPKHFRLYAMGGGALCLLCILIAFSNANDQTSGGYGMVNASPGVGIVLSFIAATSLIIVPLVIKQPGESLQTDFATFKSSLNDLKVNIPAFTNTAQTKSDNKMAELEKIIKWRDEGKISQQEYDELKAKII